MKTRKQISEMIMNIVYFLSVENMHDADLSEQDLRRELSKELLNAESNRTAFDFQKEKGYNDVRKDAYHEFGGRVNVTIREFGLLTLTAMQQRNIVALKDIAKHLDEETYARSYSCLEDFSAYFEAASNGKMEAPKPGLTVATKGGNPLDTLIPDKTAATTTKKGKKPTTATESGKDPVVVAALENIEAEKEAAGGENETDLQEDVVLEGEDTTIEDDYLDTLQDSFELDYTEEAFNHLQEIVEELDKEKLEEMRTSIRDNYDLLKAKETAKTITDEEHDELVITVKCHRLIFDRIKALA